MSEIQLTSKLPPVIVLPNGKMKKTDMNRLRKSGFCVVECDDPTLVRFLDPPLMSYPAPERAAIGLCRYLQASQWKNVLGVDYIYKKDFSALLCEFLVQGTPIETVKNVPAVPQVKK